MAGIPKTDAEWQAARQAVDTHLDAVVQSVGSTADQGSFDKDARFGNDLQRAAGAAVKTVEDCPAAFVGEKRYNAGSLEDDRVRLENLNAVKGKIETTHSQIVDEIRVTTARLSTFTGYVVNTIEATHQMPVKPAYSNQLNIAGAELISVLTDRSAQRKEALRTGKKAKSTDNTKTKTIGRLSVENKFLAGDELTPADVIQDGADADSAAQPTAAAKSGRRPARRNAR